MSNPTVKNAHIVSRTYLKGWAHGRTITARILDTGVTITTSVDKVGTRRHFYRRALPDGTKTDDVESSLAEAESRAAPLLREVDERWPLSVDDKFTLAAFFAVQLTRGPQWIEWYERATYRFLDDEYEAGHLEAAAAEGGMSTDDVHQALAQDFLGDTERLSRMLTQAQKTTSALGSMHWTLLEFDTPIVATSDQPVAMWPLESRSRPPEPNELDGGLMMTLEFRIPLSPTRALLLTWADLQDHDPHRVRGRRQHAGNLNAFTVAQADRQWFHAPGKSPPIASGRLLPLSPELVRGYDRRAAQTSLRRSKAGEVVSSLIGQPAAPSQTIVYVT
jgi:Protein of unknown function (DUF4238)